MLSTALMHVTLSTHNFAVSRLTPRTRELVMQFARGNMQMGLVRAPGGRFTSAPVKVFAASVADKSKFRFHINQLKDFEEFLGRNYINQSLYTVEHKPVPVGVAIETKVIDLREPRNEQPKVITYLGNEDGNRSKFVDLQTGKGKATSLDTLVRIPGGWKPMGDIKINDLVTAKDGTPTKVIAIYPQGIVQLYRVTFSDGRYVDCCAEHLWKVYYINTTIKRRWRVVNTLEVMRLISMPNPRVYIDLIEAEDHKDLLLPIDPYILGVYLGDGGSTGWSVVLTTADKEIASEITSLLPDDLKLSEGTYGDKCSGYRIVQRFNNGGENSFIRDLNSLGLRGQMSHEKFIPLVYLEGSRQQRLALLQGLMDTDGTIGAPEYGGSISFVSTSLRLAEGVQYLVRSLGGIASISNRQTSYTYNGENKPGKPSFQVNVRYKKPSELFKLLRKLNRTNDNNQYALDLKLRVKSVVESAKAQAQCITVEHPEQLFVVNDFIVTHNTYCALTDIGNYGQRVVCIVKPGYIEKWISDFKGYFDCVNSDIMVVKGSAHLMGLLQMAKDGKLKSKFIIISNKTLQNYLKFYEQMQEGILDMGYACLPENLFEYLGSGLRLIDEVHQDFHLNFKIDLYTNVAKSVSLSATLLNNDPFIERMYKLAYPVEKRYTGILDKYVVAKAVMYSLQSNTYVRTTEFGSTSYSHIAFEKSIMKNHIVRDTYFKLIANTVGISFIKNYVKGDKCAVFCASIDMCTEFTKYIQKQYPHLDVRRYVAEDPYENLIEPDIRVTTILSGGTAHDIPGLTTVVLTIGIDSIQANIQTVGRLRKIKDRVVNFLYLVCNDIPKHLEYHGRKEKMLQQRAHSFQIINAPFPV